MSSTRHRFPFVSSGKRVGYVFPLAALALVSAAGFATTCFFQPEKYAKVNHCATYNETELTYSNTCDFEVNIQYCMFSEAGVERDFCRDFTLAPGASTPSLRSDLNQLGGLLNNQKIACKAPYRPGQRRNANTKRWEPACMKEGDPEIGPHVTRKPRAFPGQPF